MLRELRILAITAHVVEHRSLPSFQLPIQLQYRQYTSNRPHVNVEALIVDLMSFSILFMTFAVLLAPILAFWWLEYGLLLGKG
jgi:predicted S18 family serine protease